jgi:hypothetical protein
VSFKPDDIAQVELSFPGASPIVVKRAKKEDVFSAENAPAGTALKLEKITGLLGTLSSLRFSDTSPTDDPSAVEASKSPRTVKLTRFDGKTITIALGRKPEQKIIKAPDSNTKQGLPAEALEAATETIPAGPVFVFVKDSDARDPVNALMRKRAFQVFEYSFTCLPQKPDELFQPLQPAAPAKTQ